MYALRDFGVDFFVFYVPDKNTLAFCHHLLLQCSLFIQIIPQALGPAGVAELAQGFGLDLAHPLPGDVELPAQLFQRPGAAILQTEAEGAIYERELTDILDILQEVLREAKSGRRVK